jgi:hypothetical protein
MHVVVMLVRHACVMLVTLFNKTDQKPTVWCDVLVMED